MMVDDNGFNESVKGNTLRDTPLLALRSDNMCKDAIALRNILTFNQVYNLAKLKKEQKLR